MIIIPAFIITITITIIIKYAAARTEHTIQPGLLTPSIVTHSKHHLAQTAQCHFIRFARFFMSNGSDLYYLSHPRTHQCLQDPATCDYLASP